MTVIKHGGKESKLNRKTSQLKGLNWRIGKKADLPVDESKRPLHMAKQGRDTVT